MDYSIAGVISNANIDNSFDITSALKGKYTEFINIFAEMSKSMMEGTAMTFPAFPNQPVKPEDASYALYANYTMTQFEEQLQVLMDAEKWKGTADKQMIQAMGG
ncbi:MAG: hypothetical protein JW873_01270 [Candidatus Saganbacteria bacterium]|nr:hypothetical protein [Candidatus Saganbacteria bacterium]